MLEYFLSDYNTNYQDIDIVKYYWYVLSYIMITNPTAEGISQFKYYDSVPPSPSEGVIIMFMIEEDYDSVPPSPSGETIMEFVETGSRDK